VIDPQFVSVAQSLLTFAKNQPNRTAITLVTDMGQEEPLTYADLHSRASAISGDLLNRNVGKGDVLILSLPHSQALITTLIAAFYIGAIPAILPYDLSSPKRPKLIQQLINLTTHAKAVITTPDRCASLAANMRSSDHGVEIFAPSTAEPCDVTEHTLNGSGQDPAYMQYTSGTTGQRKGALLSNTAILTCVREFADRLRIEPATDAVVNWLPLHHDYGLFAGVMTPLLTGTHGVLLSPARCMRRPHALFKAIQDHNGTHSWSTNSALHFFANHTPKRETSDLDISSLRVLCAGGEPTRFDTLNQFNQRFKPIGLRSDVLMSGYGMTETTMGVTVCDPSVPPRVDWVDAAQMHKRHQAMERSAQDQGSIPFISNGYALPSTQVRIVNADGHTLSDRSIGHIEISGKTVMMKYHRNPDGTQKALQNGWLRTNDMGYLAHEHLFVIGREDDRIIVGGKVIHPAEIERMAESFDQIPAGKCVAFGVDDAQRGTERIVLICGLSVKPNDPHDYALDQAIREKCKDHLDVTLSEIHFVPKGWILKTANGKMPRRANRDKFLAEKSNH
jgi:acyl-CoA synthetase (AMP-forming)/AMP-acid ligase II